MSLADALAAVTAPPAVLCKVGRWAETLTPDDVDTLAAALADEGLDTMTLARAINSQGADVSHSTLARHRRKECPCESR